MLFNTVYYIIKKQDVDKQPEQSTQLSQILKQMQHSQCDIRKVSNVTYVILLSTDVTEETALTTPVVQVVHPRSLFLLQTERMERLTTHAAVDELEHTTQLTTHAAVDELEHNTADNTRGSR